MHLKEWIPSATSFSRSSFYGIRVYTSGSILAPHVDRDPLISSAIINVGQDVDEEWPLEVYDHEGLAHNITMTPGDVVLYESHSVLHGRPFPLRGNILPIYLFISSRYSVGRTVRKSVKKQLLKTWTNCKTLKFKHKY